MRRGEKPQRVEQHSRQDHLHRSEAVGDHSGKGLSQPPDQILERQSEAEDFTRPALSKVTGCRNSPCTWRIPKAAPMTAPAAKTMSQRCCQTFPCLVISPHRVQSRPSAGLLPIRSLDRRGC